MHGLGRDKEAVAHYEEALRARPDFDRAHFNLATVLDDQGRIEEAITQWKEIVARGGEATLLRLNAWRKDSVPIVDLRK